MCNICLYAINLHCHARGSRGKIAAQLDVRDGDDFASRGRIVCLRRPSPIGHKYLLTNSICFESFGLAFKENGAWQRQNGLQLRASTMGRRIRPTAACSAPRPMILEHTCTNYGSCWGRDLLVVGDAAKEQLTWHVGGITASWGSFDKALPDHLTKSE